MARYTNKSGSTLDGVKHDAIGEWPNTKAVRAMVQRGVLLPVDGEAPEAPASEARAPTDVEELRASFQDAYDARTRELRAAERERDALKARVAELEAAGSKTAKELRAELAAAKARITELEAPAPPPAPPAPAPAEG